MPVRLLEDRLQTHPNDIRDRFWEFENPIPEDPLEPVRDALCSLRTQNPTYYCRKAPDGRNELCVP